MTEQRVSDESLQHYLGQASTEECNCWSCNCVRDLLDARARVKVLEESCGEWSDIASGQSEQIALWRPVIQAARRQESSGQDWVAGKSAFYGEACEETERCIRKLGGNHAD